MATTKKIVMAAAGVASGTTTTPTLTQSFDGGVLAGGVSQSSYTTWAFTFTAPALPAGSVAGERQFFVMTGTRDSNGAVRNNRFTNTLVSLRLVNSSNSIDTTLTRANMSVEVDGHSDFNSAIIGHIPADAVNSTTITVTRSYSQAGGSDFMGVLVVDGVTSFVSSTVSSNNSQNTNSSVSVNTGTTGTLGTAQLRMVVGASSNSSTSNPVYNKNANEPTYTTLGQGENGTSERFGTFFAFTNTNPITQAISGTVSTSIASNNGLGHAAALINLS
tara:strand:+ start:3506 stop:4330 length:825 start_codon:yes stop_codon:yes gene_type:complete